MIACINHNLPPTSISEIWTRGDSNSLRVSSEIAFVRCILDYPLLIVFYSTAPIFAEYAKRVVGIMRNTTNHHAQTAENANYTAYHQISIKITNHHFIYNRGQG